MKEKVRKAFVDTLPIMAGYIVLGIGFGVLLKSAGYGLVWALAMSIFIYAGSMQYAMVGLVTGGASWLTVAITTFLVNARHLFYGMSMLEKYKGTGIKKPYLIFGLTDETYSLVCNSEEDSNYFFLVSLFDQIYWITGSVIGSVLGAIIPFNTDGIDFSLTALFVVVVTDQWLKTKNHIPAIIGIVASVVCLILCGSSSFLIPSMIVILVMLFSMKKYCAEEAE